jgi:hypothetical protein
LYVEHGQLSVTTWTPDIKYFQGHFAEHYGDFEAKQETADMVLPGHWTMEHGAISALISYSAGKPGSCALLQKTTLYPVGMIVPGDTLLTIARVVPPREDQDKKLFTAQTLTAVGVNVVCATEVTGRIAPMKLLRAGISVVIASRGEEDSRSDKRVGQHDQLDIAIAFAQRDRSDNQSNSKEPK